MKIAGWTAKETTADAYQSDGQTPDDLEDAYVIKDGRLQEVWDCGIERPDGKVTLYGRWPDGFDVDPQTTIYYSPPERWEAK